MGLKAMWDEIAIEIEVTLGNARNSFPAMWPSGGASQGKNPEWSQLSKNTYWEREARRAHDSLSRTVAP